MFDLRWVAEYADGTTLKQKPGKYATLSREGLKKFCLVDESGKTKASVDIKDAEVLFYRRRTLRVGTPSEYSIYLLGHRKRKATGKVINHILILKSDGTVLEDHLFRNEWFQPAWFPSEQV